MTMIDAVITGKCLGRRDASDKGTTVPTVCLLHCALRSTVLGRAERVLSFELVPLYLFKPTWQGRRGRRETMTNARRR